MGDPLVELPADRYGVDVAGRLYFGDGPTDNSPDDVYSVAGPGSYTGYVASASFICDELACTPAP